MSFYLFIAISFYPFISVLCAKILCVNGDPSIFLLPIFFYIKYRWRQRACGPFAIKRRHLK